MNALFRYLSADESVRQNAYRHEAKGLWWIEQGFDDYARGSFRKAARWDRKADQLAELLKPSDDPFLRMVYELTKKAITQQIFSANSDAPSP